MILVLTEIEITIPAGTKETDPVMIGQKLPYRIITKIGVHFPVGVNSMAYTSLFYGEEQLFPYRRGKWVTGNAETVKDKPFLDLRESKAEINIRGKSPFSTHKHTLIWRISTLPVEVARWREALVFIASKRGLTRRV